MYDCFFFFFLEAWEGDLQDYYLSLPDAEKAQQLYLALE